MFETVPSSFSTQLKLRPRLAFKTTLRKTMSRLFQDFFNTTLKPPKTPLITPSSLLEDYLKNYLGHFKLL